MADSGVSDMLVLTKNGIIFSYKNLQISPFFSYIWVQFPHVYILEIASNLSHVDENWKFLNDDRRTKSSCVALCVRHELIRLSSEYSSTSSTTDQVCAFRIFVLAVRMMSERYM